MTNENTGNIQAAADAAVSAALRLEDRVEQARAMRDVRDALRNHADSAEQHYHRILDDLLNRGADPRELKEQLGLGNTLPHILEALGRTPDGSRK